VIVFLDTSALVKLYIAESGSAALRERVDNTVAAVSHLTFGESYATFARRLREGLLTAEEHDAACNAFEGDWRTLMKIPFGDDVLAQVPELFRQHPLRGADALQLACATMLRDQGVKVLFCTSDQRLLASAHAEGLLVFDPENP
jgi:hypothetical protein